MTSGSEKLEHQLRAVEYCNMKPKYPGDSMQANYNLALLAARMLKRQRKEIADLMAELAYHGIYPRPLLGGTDD